MWRSDPDLRQVCRKAAEVHPVLALLWVADDLSALCSNNRSAKSSSWESKFLLSNSRVCWLLPKQWHCSMPIALGTLLLQEGDAAAISRQQWMLTLRYSAATRCLESSACLCAQRAWCCRLSAHDPFIHQWLLKLDSWPSHFSIHKCQCFAMLQGIIFHSSYTAVCASKCGISNPKITKTVLFNCCNLGRETGKHCCISLCLPYRSRLEYHRPGYLTRNYWFYIIWYHVMFFVNFCCTAQGWTWKTNMPFVFFSLRSFSYICCVIYINNIQTFFFLLIQFQYAYFLTI